MARNSLARLRNQSGHQYQWYADGRCYVCSVCGTAEHRNGRFYYVGRWSKSEPPCDGNHIARKEWLDKSLPDDEVLNG